jgi:hypothetical protein
MRRRAIGLLVWAAALAGSAGAQGRIAIPDARAGDLVRVRSHEVLGSWATGSLVAANQGFVALAVRSDVDAIIEVPWAHVASIDIESGRTRPASAGKGAVIGLTTALVVAPALRSSSSASPAARNSAAGVALVGLPLVGAVLGWREAPSHWRPVAWRPSIDTVLPEGEAVRLRLPANTRVRVRVGRETLSARTLDSRDSLVVRTGSTRQAWGWAQVFEVRVPGRRNRLRGAALGATAMAIVAVMRARARPLDADGRTDSLVRHVLAGGVIGGAIGTPGWIRVPIPVRGR